MIDDVLKRELVVGSAQEMLDSLNSPEAADHLTAEEIEFMKGLLEPAIAEQQQPSGHTDAEDLKTYMPADQALAVLQSTVEVRAQATLEIQTVDAPLGTDQVVPPPGLEAYTPFDEKSDWWGYVKSFVKSTKQFVDDRLRFKLPGAPKVNLLAPKAKIILVGDWGTGERLADAVADRIRAELATAGAGVETHVVHLGDVYYTGTQKEAHERFLDHWPVRPGGEAQHRSWCLNGNHDMYAAGEGLFKVILTDPRFDRQRTTDIKPTSEFHLANEHWQVLGMDSAWQLRHDTFNPKELFLELKGHAGHFDKAQLDRLTAAVTPGGPATILLTHHQPFTRQGAGEDGIEYPGEMFKKTAAIRDIGLAGWFWGHEHVCRTYGPRAGIGHPACVGHGAIPVDGHKAAHVAAGEWELTDGWYDDEGDKWRKCGFAVLDIDGAAATVRYVDHEGNESRAAAAVPRPG